MKSPRPMRCGFLAIQPGWFHRTGFHPLALLFRPKGFSLKDVKQSIALMKKADKHVSLNYFILPGFTDDPDEFDAFCHLVDQYKPDLIQLRNLNMDPEWYCRTIRFQPNSSPMGISRWYQRLRERFSNLRFGYFNPPVR